jgi:hypothetical protein
MTLDIPFRCGIKVHLSHLFLHALVGIACSKAHLATLISKLAMRPVTTPSRTPQVTKHTPRVEPSQASNSKDDHRPLKDHEARLVIRKTSTKPLPQLSNSVDAPHKDEHRCNK